jgi:hypothetical protein
MKQVAEILFIVTFLSTFLSCFQGKSNTDAKPTQFHVVYNANTDQSLSGTMPVDSNIYTEGQTVTILRNSGQFSLYGYTCIGWNTSPDGSGTTVGKTLQMGNSDITLYAIWMTGTIVFGISETECWVNWSQGVPENLVIPDSVFGMLVTRIGQLAFELEPNLKTVSIPNSVTKIGHEAFSRCFKLEAIVLSNNTATIEWESFADCSNLTNITIPQSVTFIGNAAFDGCSNLANITFLSTTPPTIDNGGELFNGIPSNAKIHVPDINAVVTYQNAPGWASYASMIVTP